MHVDPKTKEFTVPVESPDGGLMYASRDDAPGSANQHMIRSGLRKPPARGDSIKVVPRTRHSSQYHRGMGVSRPLEFRNGDWADASKIPDEEV